ncbi:hypothetical protein JHK84_050902 [Glycine max]|nr:hypothetical protein JHK84_050902 [Glycine max]
MALTVAANATPLDIQVHTVPLKVFGTNCGCQQEGGIFSQLGQQQQHPLKILTLLLNISLLSSRVAASCNLAVSVLLGNIFRVLVEERILHRGDFLVYSSGRSMGYFAFVHDEMSGSYGVLVTTHEGGNNNTRKMAKLKPTRTKPQSFPFPKSGPQPISTLWRRQNHHQPSTINLLLPRLSSSIVVDHFSSSFVLHRSSSASIVDRSKTRFKRCGHQGQNTNGCCYLGVSRRPPNWIPPPPDEDVTPLMVSCPMPSSQLVMMTFMPTPRLPPSGHGQNQG